ncbi:hypothetical protein M569_05894 [Genlisea aurea]|uniref:Uncharacterized protein n=1 Tax=Genlisea aurea TaxID=192259 RepID=S8CQ89_9LAMI|nr:hypothetical protein M569_05894 [Genlisea aurea]
MSKSGVGIDARTHMVFTEDGICEEIIKEFPGRKKVKGKKWPYYERWLQIFGQDRACREDAQSFADARKHLDAMFGNDDGKDGEKSLPTLLEVHRRPTTVITLTHLRANQVVNAPGRKEKRGLKPPRRNL